jgi:O-methyltransferase
MVPDAALRAFARQLILAHDDRIPGSVVECGSWMGGTGILAARVLSAVRDDRPIFLCDSFEGLPPPAPVDGPAAHAWAANPEGPSYYDNCRAEYSQVVSLLEARGFSERIQLVRGWFETTLPLAVNRFGSIAVLRIDADWHASVKIFLESLYDSVSQGGFVIFDDYDTWDGCAVAVHEFLGQRGLPHRIQRDGCAYIRKI